MSYCNKNIITNTKGIMESSVSTLTIKKLIKKYKGLKESSFLII